MTCLQCGNTLNSGATFCGDCGAPIKKAEAEPATVASSPGSIKFRSLSLTAWKTMKAAVLNPTEELSTVFRGLKKRDALEVGLVLAGLFDLCAVIGLYMLLPHWAGQPGIEDILKLLLLGIVPSAAITGASVLARKVFHGSPGTIESDVFVAGISLFPTGLMLILAGILGAGNIEVVALVSVFAISYTILILYTGCTQILEIPKVRAVPAVPIMILIAGWISKIVFAMMF
jgi:hypothetical protein